MVEKEKAVFGEDRPYTLNIMDALAWAYMKRGRWAESEELQLTVIEKRKMVLVPGHPSTLRSMSKLAYLLRALGRRKSAFDLMSSCVDLSPHVLGRGHEDAKDWLQLRAEWETEDNSRAGALAAGKATDRLVGDGAWIVQSVRNVFAAMKL